MTSPTRRFADTVGDQADGRMITVGRAVDDGFVTVTGLAADTDLSEVAADATVTAKVVGLDISGNAKLLGHVDTYKVLDGKVLTLSAIQANESDLERPDDGTTAKVPS